MEPSQIRFIQLLSGESLDPLPIEQALDASPFVSRSCLVGVGEGGAAKCVCVIVEPNFSDGDGVGMKAVRKAVAVMNRDLAPPLRIAWSRILILGEGERLPLTRKRTIFRKKLGELFGERLARLINDRSRRAEMGREVSRARVEETVLGVVEGCLGMEREMTEGVRECTFAEVRTCRGFFLHHAPV